MELEQSEAIPSQALSTQILGAAPIIDDGTMDDIVDRLKLLEYETKFCPVYGKPTPFKMLSRTYFSGASDNPNTQFFYFTSLVSWLLNIVNRSGKKESAWGQFDDPSATSTNILQEMKALFPRETQGLAPNRIRQGHGEAVLLILCLLIDKALVTQGFQFRPIKYPVGGDGSDAVASVAAEASTSLRGEDAEAVDDDLDIETEDSGDELYVHRGFGAKTVNGGEDDEDDDHEMIVPQVAADAWYLECERVAPSIIALQQKINEESALLSDWRGRIERASVLLKGVEKMYPDVKSLLDHLGDDLKKAQERIQKREATLSAQFSEQVEEYKIKLRDLNSAQGSLKQSGEAVNQLSVELNQLSEHLEQVKGDISDREGKISDSTPLMKIKEAVHKIRNEIKEMSLRIGILQHTVLHYTLRQAQMKRERPLDVDDSGYDMDTAIQY